MKRLEICYQFWNAFIAASFATKVILAVVILIAFKMVLAFLLKAIPEVFQNVIAVISGKFFSIIGREITLGMRNGSKVERADYLMMSLMIGAMVVLLISCLSFGIKGLVLLGIFLLCVISVAAVGLISVYLVSLEERRKSLIGSSASP